MLIQSILSEDSGSGGVCRRTYRYRCSRAWLVPRAAGREQPWGNRLGRGRCASRAPKLARLSVGGGHSSVIRHSTSAATQQPTYYGDSLWAGSMGKIIGTWQPPAGKRTRGVQSNDYRCSSGLVGPRGTVPIAAGQVQ